jgi:hypothetical protein
MFDAGYGARYLMAHEYEPGETDLLEHELKEGSLLWRLQQDILAAQKRGTETGSKSRSKMQAV